MLYTLESAKANIRNRDGKRVFFLGKDDRLTSEARDYLNSQRIAILPAEQAHISRYRLLGGGWADQKPEHMTHLHGDVLVPKTHPRIAFRGAIDTLEAEILLTQKLGQQEALEDVLELARRLIRCDVLNEPVGSISLCGLDEQTQRRHSHFPQEYYQQPHFMPSKEDSELILRLNRTRCAARAAELAAAHAFTDADGVASRPDILQAMNRLSSMLYILMIREKAKQDKRI